MPLPASLPQWVGNAPNPAQFGKGLQIGEGIRADKAAEQFKQQEMQRQKQQDAIAQQNHQQEVMRQQQQDAVQEQRWQAEFGLQKAQNDERIATAAKKFAAQTAYQAEVKAANGDPRKIQAALAQYGPQMGMNPGPMLAQNERTRASDVQSKNRLAVALHAQQMRAEAAKKKPKLMDPATKQRLATLMQNRKALLAGGAPQTQAALMKDQDPDPKWGESTVKNYNDARKALKEIDAQIQAISGGQAAPTGTPPTGGPASVRVYDPKTKTFTTPAGTAAGAPAAASPAVPPPRLATPGSAANPFRLAPPAPGTAPAASLGMAPAQPRIAKLPMMMPPKVPSMSKDQILGALKETPDEELIDTAKGLGVNATAVGEDEDRFMVQYPTASDPTASKLMSGDEFALYLASKAKGAQPQQPPMTQAAIPSALQTPPNAGQDDQR